MEIKVADERILVIDSGLSLQDAEKKAQSRKLDGFGTVIKVASFLSKPKEEDFELTYQEFRYQPFWHIAALARYTYDRNVTYQVRVSGPEVRQVTHQSKDFESTNGHIHIAAVEHCNQESKEDILIDGITGSKNGELNGYLKLPAKAVTPDSLQSGTSQDAIFVPPQVRISGIMREILSRMIKGIQADKIFEEHVEVTCVDLYYYPVYAFQYHWKTKGKDAIVEVDGATSEVRFGNRTFKEYMGKVLDRDFLFDIGADAAGMFIPGGSIAVKVARKYIDHTGKK